MNQHNESVGTSSEFRNSQPWDPDQPTRDNEHVSSGTVPHLLRQLTGEVTSLFTKEVSLARAELRETVSGIKTGLVSLTSGSIVLLAGVIVLLMAAVYGLAEVMALWLAALIVGGVVSAIGLSMVAVGKRKLDADVLKPQRSIDAVKEDRAAMKAAVTGGRP
ncbi:MAG: hypothetical protein RLZZ227_3118 [Pseudomonadota bacterium]|jgi:hypothetical protein